MENTCKPMAVSFQCMTKFTTNKKKIKKKFFKKKGKKKTTKFKCQSSIRILHKAGSSLKYNCR